MPRPGPRRVQPISQYPRDRDYEGMAPTIIDPDGDTWVWTTADKHMVPGYQWAGGTTTPRLSYGIGPAYTREYVERGRYKVASWRPDA
jgi:hypothetical protein